MGLILVAQPAPFDIEHPTNGALIINLKPLVKRINDDQFFEFCVANADLRIERKANGEIVIMPPEGGTSGGRNATITAELVVWTRQDGRGVAFGSSAGFRLPNGATYGPDAAWVRRDRLEQLTQREKERFLPLCPDFVIELRSASDRLRPLQEKMEEYIDNGALLGWLIDPTDHSVYIYRPHQPVERQMDVISLSGDPELPGFVLDLASIWNPGF
jgi:Uma2 family endonuclease